VLAAVPARAEAAEAVADSEWIQSAAAAVRALIVAGLVEEAAAHEAVTALTTADLIVAAAGQATVESLAEDAATVEAADEVAAASLAQSLATIAADDEVAVEAAGEAEVRVRAASITMAEAQVLRYLPKPLPSSVIADKLGISRSAAKERAARLYKRLGVHSRDEAVSPALTLGLIRG
jgi:DNA-binding NarL/FixJ family response regulator